MKIVRSLTCSAREIARRVRARLAPSRLAVSAAATIDLDGCEVSRDPYPHYEVLRRGGPVQFLPRHNAWVVLGYDEVQEAMGRPDRFSNEPYAPVDAVLLGADPPEHTAVRRIVVRQFSSDTLGRLQALAERRAASLLQNRLDVVTGYGLPLSEAVAAALLGFDEGTVGAIHKAEADCLEFADFARALDALADRGTMYPQFIADGIADLEARSLVRLIWLASTKTTERTIGHAIRILLQERHIHPALSRDMALVPAFVDEVLRLHVPELIIRRATTGVVELGGVELPPESVVYLCIAAANRDPRKFTDAGSVRFDRRMRHIGFGFGIHHCVGASLGRRVIEAAVRTLLVVAPSFRAAQPLDAIEYSSTHKSHAIVRLMIDTATG